MHIWAIDLSFATSQPKSLLTKIEQLWKAINANQVKIAIVGNNVKQIVDFVKNKTTNYERYYS